jgi:hypothetical protein
VIFWDFFGTVFNFSTAKDNTFFAQKQTFALKNALCLSGFTEKYKFFIEFYSYNPHGINSCGFIFYLTILLTWLSSVLK